MDNSIETATQDPGARRLVETRRELEQVRLEVVDSVRQLGTTVRAAVDWKGPVRLRPWLFVGLAMATGLLLGLSHSKRRTHHHPRSKR